MVEEDDVEVRVGLMLFFDAYDEFERTGKITYLTRVCFEYPIFQKLFLQLMGELEDPHNHPYFLKKQVDKRRDRKPLYTCVWPVSVYGCVKKRWRGGASRPE